MDQGKYYKMERRKICNLLNDSTVSKFVTRKWIDIKIYGIESILSTRIKGSTPHVKIRFG